jgi:hypothetical protein
MDTLPTTSTTYSPPVDQLLKLGDCRRRPRPPYHIMGFTPEHVPELIRMSIDPELNWANAESDEVWAPVHAWRVLGLLRAEEAVEPLLGLLEEFEDSTWPGEEFPEVFGRIGPAAIPALARYLADRSRDTWHRATCADGLAKIGAAWPEARGECVATLVRLLEDPAEDDRDLLGSVVCELLDLDAVEAAPAMERAFAEDRVELSAAGDWEDVQVELGLLPKRITPARNYLLESLPGLAEVVSLIKHRAPVPARVHAFVPAPASGPMPRRARASSATTAAKRKREKEARRKNRRRK